MDLETQIQWLLEDINDMLLFDDEEHLNFFDLKHILGNLEVSSSVNIGRELLEDKVELFTALLSNSLGRAIHPEQSRTILIQSESRAQG